MPLSSVVRFKYYSGIRILFFLFPIAILGVRHWGSTIFGLLVLPSLFYLPKIVGNNLKLYREEKVLIWILFGYFIAAVMSITANGWDQAGVYSIGIEVRFLLIIPLYLVVRQCDDLWKYLLTGSLFGIVFSTGYGFYELFVSDNARVYGIYGPLVFGPVLLLLIMLQLPGNRQLGINNRRNYLIAIIAVAGLYVVIMTGARSAYLALNVGIILSFIYYLKARNSVILLIIACLLLVFVFFNINVAKKRVEKAFANTRNYIEYMIDHPGRANKYGDTSAGQRMEVWRASVYLFSENPIFGVGRYNFYQKIQKYADERVINKKSAYLTHPHNVFFEAMADKGIFGLVTVLMLYFYPLYFFVKSRNASRESAFSGILLMVSILIFSLTEAMPVYFSNFLAVFMLYLLVIFSWHVRQIHTGDDSVPATTSANRIIEKMV